jgi:cyclophilin family peptidyl-prolyl cis-trans isomerase
MARSADPNSAGCQFYILKRAAPHLDGQYAIFGQTLEGAELIPKIQPGDVMKTVRILRGPKGDG